MLIDKIRLLVLTGLVVALATQPCPAIDLVESAKPSWYDHTTFLERDGYARRMLTLALSNKPRCNLDATICFTDHDNSVSKFRVLMNTQGVERIESLDDSSDSGKIVIDNLDTRTTYLQEKGQVNIEKSPRTLQDLDEKIRLIFRNYRVSTKRVTLLQRSVVEITSRPYLHSLPTTIIYVDPKSGFILQTITSQEGQHKVAFYQTCALTYPDSISADSFSLTSTGTVKTVQKPTPRFINSLSNARSKIGFNPIGFKRYSAGFQTESMFILGNHHPHGVGMQLTNGLTYATVFQLKASKAEKWMLEEQPGVSVKIKNGILVRVFCRESAEIRKMILAGF